MMLRKSFPLALLASALIPGSVLAQNFQDQGGRYDGANNGAATSDHRKAVDPLDGQQTLCTERSGKSEKCRSYENTPGDDKSVFTAQGAQRVNTALTVENQPDQGAKTVNTADNAETARMSDKADCVKAWKNRSSDHYCGPNQRTRTEYEYVYSGGSNRDNHTTIGSSYGGGRTGGGGRGGAGFGGGSHGVEGANEAGGTGHGPGPGAAGGSSGGSGGSGGSSGGRVVCTELVRQGLMTKRQKAIGTRWVEDYHTEMAFNGYQLWAMPVVRTMRRDDAIGRATTRAMAALFVPRANEIMAYYGHGERSLKGLAARKVIEPVSWLVGLGAKVANKTAEPMKLYDNRYPVV